METPHFLDGLTRPGTWRSNDGSATFDCVIVGAGEIDLPSGRVCIGDPFMIEAEAQTIGRTLTPGRYPVKLCVAQIGPGNDRVAGAMLVLSDSPVAAWVPALYETEGLDIDEDDDEEDESRGYGVDVATSCFIAHESAAELQDADDDALDRWSDQLGDAIEEAERAGRSWITDSSGQDRMIAFPSGLGDGFYYNWWGMNADNEPAVLVTAFDLLEETSRLG